MTSKRFNDAGPILVDKHYHVPRLQRINLQEVLKHIEESKYFVLHAPRQTGKTSTLYALMDLLNSGSQGSYRCVVANVESAQAVREDIDSAIYDVITEVGFCALDSFGDSFILDQRDSVIRSAGPRHALTRILSSWAQQVTHPIVLIIDEIDSLVGASLISVLRQLRTGYQKRHTSEFPKSVILCGVRDVRDYRIRSKDEQEPVMGGSAFNISIKSLRLRDFSKEEVFSLLEQHTNATGQSFELDAKEYIWEQTNGQPWLVNRLAGGTVDLVGDLSNSLTRTDVGKTREEMILSRVVHIDQLINKLQEPRVRRVVEPILVGAERVDGTHADIEYVRDLGLIAVDDPIRIANPIYTEVIPRELTAAVQASIRNEYHWYVKEDNTLDMMALMRGFQKFFRANSESWSQLYDFKEAGPHLLLQAFMQRVINAGGEIFREYALGKFRTDLLIVWPVSDTITEKIVIECKVKHGSKAKTIEKGSQQAYKYADRSGAQQTHLVIFDCDPNKSWKERLYCEQYSLEDQEITVWGC